MAKIKSETRYGPAFPGGKHSFDYTFNTKRNTFNVRFPAFMASALGRDGTPPAETMEAAERALAEACRDFTSRETKTELVIAVQYMKQKGWNESGSGLMIRLRARLFTRKTTTFRGGKNVELEAYDFRIKDEKAFAGFRLEEERLKSWRRLDPSSFWNVKAEGDAHVIDHTPELEAFLLAMADAIEAAQNRLGAMFGDAAAITTAANVFATAGALPEVASIPAHKAAVPGAAVVASSVEVFSRPECVFNYCPHPAQCRTRCKTSGTPADESVEALPVSKPALRRPECAFAECPHAEECAIACIMTHRTA